MVQSMVAAQVAGVAFSADPVTGVRDRVSISAIKGLGEALVAGKEDGQRWLVANGSLFLMPERSPLLTPAQVAEVAELCRRAEQHFASPQDIEWAYDQKGLHILQSRPITTPLRPKPQRDEALRVFDNSNIIESYPGLVSPLTYSFAVYLYARVYPAFLTLLGVSKQTLEDEADIFPNLLTRLRGRVYYNLNNWYRALALLPGFSLNARFMETMMGVAAPMPQEVVARLGPPRLAGFARIKASAQVGWIGVRLSLQALSLPRTRRAFMRRLTQTLNSDLDLAAASPAALVQEYRRIERDLLDRWDAPLINDFLCMIAFGASRALLEKWLGAPGLTLHNDVMIGQGDTISAEPAQRIAAMGKMAREAKLDLAGQGPNALRAHPPLAEAFETYLAKFSDRCTEELKLESIPLNDNPKPLLAAIAASAASQYVPLLHDPPDWQGLFRGKPIKRWVARRLLGWAKARVRDRENLRFERTRIFGRARQVFLALGREFWARGLIDQPRDIFYLTKDEVLGSVEGSALSMQLSALVTLRKQEAEIDASRPALEARIEARDLDYSLLDHGVLRSAETPQPPAGDSQQGTGCSAGTVIARARVILDASTETLEPGEILVARYTDPGWIALFSNAAAIVVERGSLLSHSAIVARELGIPCIVGLKGATRWIATGDRLSVDGASGEVRKKCP